MRRIQVTVLALALSACAGGPPELGLAPTVEYAQADAMPVPAEAGAGGRYQFRLGPLDRISVEDSGIAESLRELVIDPQGFVSFPYAGPVEAQGLTAAELAVRIEEQMRRRYVRNPQIVVNLVEVNSNLITVEGQVRQPGQYPLARETTLAQAVAKAGGEGELARISTIILFREVEGQEYVGLYDLRAIRYGNYADPVVFPGDRIVIDESRSRRFFDTFQGVSNLLTTPLIILSRQI